MQTFNVELLAGVGIVGIGAYTVVPDNMALVPKNMSPDQCPHDDFSYETWTMGGLQHTLKSCRRCGCVKKSAVYDPFTSGICGTHSSGEWGLPNG